VSLPADKSIAHRSALFAALGDGTSTLRNFPDAADPQTTISCLRELGIQIETTGDLLTVYGRGLEGLASAGGQVDCGNSGTTIRLLAGVLSGQPFDSVLIGDESLSRRPMDRIALPLREMGAEIRLTNGHAPIEIFGSRALHGTTYKLPVPSAQVKSCVLLAGLYASGTTTIVERNISRDHTERMLGLNTITIDGKRHISVKQGLRIPAREWIIPRDFSAAAFFLVAASIIPGAHIRMEKVGLNPTRSALLDVLRAMGADIQVANESEEAGEPLGDVLVHSSELSGVTLSGEIIPIIMDEIPALAVAATAAVGRTEIRDASELRVKETDRIRATVDNLRRMGADVDEFDDGFAIAGGKDLVGAEVDSFGDHRMAMAMAVAGLIADKETVVAGASSASISFPGFWDELGHLVA